MQHANPVQLEGRGRACQPLGRRRPLRAAGLVPSHVICRRPPEQRSLCHPHELGKERAAFPVRASPPGRSSPWSWLSRVPSQLLAHVLQGQDGAVLARQSPPPSLWSEGHVLGDFLTLKKGAGNHIAPPSPVQLPSFNLL